MTSSTDRPPATGHDRTPATVVRSWPVALLALPAFVAIWSGWVGLGGMTGFGKVRPLPGIWDSLELDTAITLPIGVEAYAAFALGAWLTGRPVPDKARRFARWSAIGSLALGAAGQVAFHLMEAAGMTRAPWQITTLVSCLPVAVLGMGAALAHLLHTGQPEPDTAPAATGHEPLVASLPTRPPTPDTGPDVKADTEPDNRPQRPATRRRTPAKPTGQPTRTRDRTTQPDTATAIAAARRRTPAMTQADVATLLDISERTVRRHWPATAPVNGRVPEVATP